MCIAIGILQFFPLNLFPSLVLWLSVPLCIVQYLNFLCVSFRVGQVISAGGLPPSVKLLSPAEAKNNVSATIKWLYRSMFSWLVRKINHANGNLTDAGVGERVKFIGILDIFGFEILEVNSFEQLCINYSNERLQQQFNERVFVEEQKKYESEGLDGSKITFRDNQHVVDLISHRPAGLLIMLEEYSMLNRKNSGLLNTYHNTHSKQSSHPAYSRRRFRDDEGFIVKHFAGDVDYTIENFIEKNNDALQPGITELLRWIGCRCAHHVSYHFCCCSCAAALVLLHLLLLLLLCVCGLVLLLLLLRVPGCHRSFEIFICISSLFQFRILILFRVFINHYHFIRICFIIVSRNCNICFTLFSCRCCPALPSTISLHIFLHISHHFNFVSSLSLLHFVVTT